MLKISFIGCGNMGFSIAKALSESKEYSIILYSHHTEDAKKKSELINASYANTLKGAVESADIVLLAVKPQVLPSLYKEIAENLDAKLVISIAAGISLKTLSENLNTSRIVRYMPCIAASVKQSVTAFTYNEELKEEDKKLANAIALSFGSAFYLPESQFAAFIGISGSAIAYVFQFMHALALGGTKAGIPYQKSLEIATDTIVGAAALQKATGNNPIALMTSVCSAGGTTIDGIQALENGKFDATVIDAVMAAVNKNIMMENKK